MAQNDQTGQRGQSDNLDDSPMMRHLMEALKKGEDIGHYGRLTFVMVAQYFMDKDEMISLLAKQPEGDHDAKALVAEVTARGYNPPKRERILQWQQEQDFTICPNSDDPSACNVYAELRFPDAVYDNIGEYWEEKGA